MTDRRPLLVVQIGVAVAVEALEVCAARRHYICTSVSLQMISILQEANKSDHNTASKTEGLSHHGYGSLMPNNVQHAPGAEQSPAYAEPLAQQPSDAQQHATYRYPTMCRATPNIRRAMGPDRRATPSSTYCAISHNRAMPSNRARPSDRAMPSSRAMPSTMPNNRAMPSPQPYHPKT